jgi:hypothetical protein
MAELVYRARTYALPTAAQVGPFEENFSRDPYNVSGMAVSRDLEGAMPETGPRVCSVDATAPQDANHLVIA